MNTVIAAVLFGVLWLSIHQRWSGMFGFVAKVVSAGWGSSFFAVTTPGGWGAAVASTIAGWVGDWVGATGQQVLGAVVVIGTLWAGWAVIKDRSVDKPELVWLIILPLLCIGAGGPLADAITSVTGSARDAGVASVGGLIGG